MALGLYSYQIGIWCLGPAPITIGDYRDRILGFGIWCLGPDNYRRLSGLEFGAWNLALGIWFLVLVPAPIAFGGYRELHSVRN